VVDQQLRRATPHVDRIPADGVAAVVATRPDWPFEVRAGVGHLLAMADPAWTAEQIGSWLAASS
jgi:hypothetical protein